MGKPPVRVSPSAFVLQFALVLAMASAAPAALAQAYPTKPVRIMVGYSPGGGVDTTSRIVGAALAVTSGKRNAQVPNVPTFAESGVPGYDVTGWYGLCTQAKVPQSTQTRINTDLNKLLANGMPLRKRLEAQGITVTPESQQAFAAHVKSEIARWTKVVQEAGLESTKR